jgi:hypothetical protein
MAPFGRNPEKKAAKDAAKAELRDKMERGFILQSGLTNFEITDRALKILTPKGTNQIGLSKITSVEQRVSFSGTKLIVTASGGDYEWDIHPLAAGKSLDKFVENLRDATL